jgi:hypothetical protein
MKYIKVTNIVDDVSRVRLEKLGVSTKRDNDETIGQFGSGIKFAPIAAIRQGIRFIFAGNDSKGLYTMEYVVKDDEGIPSIFYKYDDYEKPSSFSADAGILSWETTFQIYREVVANAMDEATLSGNAWSINLVTEDEIIAKEGEFSVFLSATPEIMKIHRNYNAYFSSKREPIYEAGGIKLYERYDQWLRVYTKGVLVYSSEKDYVEGQPKIEGLFDYEINNLKLNEERTVSSTFELNSSIANAIASINDETFTSDIISEMLGNDYQNYYEFNSIPSYTYKYVGNPENTWAKSFSNLYENGVLIQASQASINGLATVTSKGFNPIVCNNDCFFEFLTTREVKTAFEIAGESLKYTIIEDTEDFPKLELALEIVSHVYADAAIIKDNTVIYKNDTDDNSILGFTSGAGVERNIYISDDHASNSSVEGIVATLIHEFDHFKSFIGDGDMEGRSFRSLADVRLGTITCDYWKLLTGKEINV